MRGGEGCSSRSGTVQGRLGKIEAFTIYVKKACNLKRMSLVVNPRPRKQTFPKEGEKKAFIRETLPGTGGKITKVGRKSSPMGRVMAGRRIEGGFTPTTESREVFSAMVCGGVLNFLLHPSL